MSRQPSPRRTAMGDNADPDRRSFGLLACGLAVLSLSSASGLAIRPALAQASEVYTGWLSRAGAGGYDVVAYFREGKPVEGSSSFTAQWKGATWRFASAANRDAFVAAPESFAPAYGGHCAWAASQGYKAKGDPQHWRIVDGRLYLNYDARIQSEWEKDIPRHIRTADMKWPEVKGK